LARATTAPSDVFINVPFDAGYENTFLALIASLVSLGLNPRCVLEVPPSTDRLRRLYALLRSCPFSLHDLSRVQVSASGPFRVPRFNMPFELGLAAAIALRDDQHQWRVLETMPHRVAQSLSDIAGYDPSIHNGTVQGTLEAVLDIFANMPAPPLSEIVDLFWVYRRLRRYRSALGGTIYRTNTFKKLVLAAKAFVIERTATAKTRD